MNVPDVTPLQFAILSALYDGELHRLCSLSRSIGGHKPGAVQVALRRLARRRLVERVKRTDPTRAMSLPANGAEYRLTTGGRLAWRETLEFYLHFAQNFGPRRPRVTLEATTPAPFATLPPERLADEAEAAAIAEGGSPELGRLIMALRCDCLDFAELSRLRIEDVDFSSGVGWARGPRGRRRELRLGARLLAIATEAAGPRERGPVFLNGAGLPWTREGAAHSFRKVRSRLRIDETVKLIGRGWRRRQKGRI